MDTKFFIMLMVLSALCFSLAFCIRQNDSDKRTEMSNCCVCKE